MTSGHSSCRFIKASFCQKSYQLLVTRLWPRGCLLVSSAFLMSPLLLVSHSARRTGSVLPKCHPTTILSQSLILAQSLITGFSLATQGQMFSCHYWWISCRRTDAYGGTEGIDVPNRITILVYFSQPFLWTNCDSKTDYNARRGPANWYQMTFRHIQWVDIELTRRCSLWNFYCCKWDILHSLVCKHFSYFSSQCPHLYNTELSDITQQ